MRESFWQKDSVYKFHVIEAVFIFYIRISLTTKMMMIYKQYTVCKYVKAWRSRMLLLFFLTYNFLFLSSFFASKFLCSVFDNEWSSNRTIKKLAAAVLAERVGNKLGGVRDNTNYVLKCPARFFGRLQSKYSIVGRSFLGKYFSVFFIFFSCSGDDCKGGFAWFSFHQKKCSALSFPCNWNVGHLLCR